MRSSSGERSLHEALIQKGSNPARPWLKAQIVLKEDVSEAGEGWRQPDHRGSATSEDKVYRVRKRLVEDGVAAVLGRAPRLAFP
ncbi:MAG: hypothetical protein ACRECZ_04065 [Methylocella sp.]